MHSSFLERLTACIMLVAGVVFLVPVELRPQDHVVSSAELRQALGSTAESGRRHREQVKRFLSSDPARKALKRAHIDEVKVQQVVSSLSDDEVARLSARTDKVQKDLAAGALTTEQLTYIVIALATAVIVIIIVER